MKTERFTFMILEQNGEIDTQERDLDGIAGLEQTARFVKLFENDQFKRVARVLVNGKVLVTFDSELNRFTFLRSAAHDYSTSDHCTRCGAEQFESPEHYKACKNTF